MIESTTSSKDSDSDHALEYQMILESKDPYVKISALQKMKSIISDYNGKKIKPVDRRLFRGIFMRNLKEFEEDFHERRSKMTLFEKLKEGFE